MKSIGKVALLLMMGVSMGLGQSSPPVPSVTSPLDGVTPHSLKPGEPSATYALTGLDQINYYNGTVTFELPLLTIGGRGEVSHTIVLGIKPPSYTVTAAFSIDDTTSVLGGSPVRYFNTYGTLDGYHPYSAGYGPGILMAKSSTAGMIGCSGGGYTRATSFVHLVLEVSGGTTYELYDKNGLGLASANASDCGLSIGTPTRGSVFEDQSGIGLRFESSVGELSDSLDPSQGMATSANGNAR